jgi:hypothetical protein
MPISRAACAPVARAPERRGALRETVLVLGYAALGQVGGWILGPALGFRPFSFHIAGSVFGCSQPPARAEVCVWALYNFLVFAVVPYLYFRRRYTNADLNLRLHIVEGWSAFDSPRDAALSLIFVLLQYFGPGMIKSVLTLRTGNAWVHAIGYHAVAPHVIVDTPLMVKTFGILP